VRLRVERHLDEGAFTFLRKIDCEESTWTTYWSQFVYPAEAPGAPTASRGRFSLSCFPYCPSKKTALLPSNRCFVVRLLNHLLDLVDTYGIAVRFA